MRTFDKDEAKPIHKRHPHPLVREDITVTARVQLQKTIPGRETRGTWRQDELIGGKLVVIK
jgi:hypothetical protein